MCHQTHRLVRNALMAPLELSADSFNTAMVKITWCCNKQVPFPRTSVRFPSQEAICVKRRHGNGRTTIAGAGGFQKNNRFDNVYIMPTSANGLSNLHLMCRCVSEFIGGKGQAVSGANSVVNCIDDMVTRADT